MKIRKIKTITTNLIISLLLAVNATLITYASYSDGTITILDGWWNGRFTTTGYNSIPSSGVMSSRSVSTGVSLTGYSCSIVGNTINGRVTITQYGTIRVNNKFIAQHVYVGNLVDRAYWQNVPVAVYGQ